jgi:hypothetical protein
MSGNEPFDYILLNYIKTQPANATAVAALVREPRATDRRYPRSAYLHEAGDRAIEFVALPTLSALGDLLADKSWRELEDAVRPQLAADFRRQIHSLSRSVKGSATPVPSLRHLELRRHEVPPALLGEYAGWRREVLLPYLSQLPELEAFAAYHSVVSTEPGALLLSQFSCSPARYRESVETPELAELVKHIASRYTLSASVSAPPSLWTKI